MSIPVVELDHVAVLMQETGTRTDLTLEVEAGSFTAVVGPSRAGKSLLLGLCVGSVQPEGGTIRVFGQDLTELDEVSAAAVQRRVEIVQQLPGLLSNMTLYNNVALPLRYHANSSNGDHLDAQSLHARVTDQLTALGLAKLAQHFPAQLMPGEARCAAIARALIQGPDLLLLDDPTGGLDADMVSRVAELLTACRQTHNLTIIATLRSFSPLLSATDRIVFLRNGRVEANGTHVELVARGEPQLSAYLT